MNGLFLIASSSSARLTALFLLPNQVVRSKPQDAWAYFNQLRRQLFAKAAMAASRVDA